MDEIVDGKIIASRINGTLYNGPILVDGIKGKALRFNGNRQYAHLGYYPWVQNQIVNINTETAKNTKYC